MQALVVLHRRPVGESGWLVNALCERDGHRLLLAPRRQTVQLHQIYRGAWQAEQDWPRLVLAEPEHIFVLTENALFCASYLNELLIRLLPQGEALPGMYQRYIRTLAALTGQQAAEPWLRMFEYQLLSDLGFGFHWHLDTKGDAIQASERYCFDPQSGFAPTGDSGGFPGEVLLAIHQGQLRLPELRVAKHILRQALSEWLAQPLNSRRLFDLPADV
ncbi:DNA repair protein RecO [Candidatus Thalassolituus haligoni]|uniref:DNA repair protein RecO n=1 Tax=Candidatus Thalassolituus haligoni TaxID=3100113 RepID=UPI003519A049|tara:strand:+ start:30524 stop:31174 length:651 start_codon:yes stop_codon:yes gene_type:complete